MLKKYLTILTDKLVIGAVISFLISAVVLVFTLNLTVSVLTLVLLLAAVIFQKSFSYGWLFLLSAFLLFPDAKIAKEVSVQEVFLLAMAMVSLIAISSKKVHLYFNQLAFYFIPWLVWVIFLVVMAWTREIPIRDEFYLLPFMGVLTWIILSAFQYFFQTSKRIRKFFYLIMTISLIHSVFGLFAYFTGFQTSTGMGVSSAKMQHLIFNDTQFQINGFLGSGLLLKIGANALAPLLLISITITLGAYLIRKYNIKKGEEVFTKKKLTRKFRLMDSVQFFNLKAYRKRLKEGDDSIIFDKNNWFLFLVLIQFLTLTLTFSYLSLVALSIGLLAMGILLRKKFLISLAIGMIVVFTLIFPSLRTSVVSESNQNIEKWFSGIEKTSNHWMFGSGLEVDKSYLLRDNIKIYNSYLYFWNTFGLVGLAVLIGALFECLRQIVSAYKTSDGEKRVWLVVLLAIWLEMILISFSGNFLFFGPAALVFWLFYAISLNLQERRVSFGITETKFRWK